MPVVQATSQATKAVIDTLVDTQSEPTRGLEPRTARLQEVFTPRLCCLVLKILRLPLPIAVLRGWQRLDFMDKTMDSGRPRTRFAAARVAEFGAFGG